ncbi:MAG: hypothetical protein C5B50_01055 [Verrucomicrobia bacterium]|nr:MAG: hypothetical protein C5B50_01055 [Verrucomicrobiota bacterium]
MFKFKRFQKEDLSRAATHDGVILGSDTGTGKSIYAYAWPLLKVGLLRQPSQEAAEITDLRNQIAALQAQHATTTKTRFSAATVQRSRQIEQLQAKLTHLLTLSSTRPLANCPPAKPLCPAQPVLLIATGDLHEQLIAEGQKHFGVTPTIIDSQETFFKLSTLNPTTGRRTIAQGYYLTTYTALARNGVTSFPDLDLKNPSRMMEVLNLKQIDLDAFYANRGNLFQRHYSNLYCTPGTSGCDLDRSYSALKRECNNRWQEKNLDEAYDVLRHFQPFAAPDGDPALWTVDCLSPDQRKAVMARFVTIKHTEYSQAIGESRYPRDPSSTLPPIKCCYSPSLADLCADTFAVVVADEGTKIKGEDTLIGKGTRQMNPKYRLVLSATPIKNRLPDVFRLAHWSTGAHRLANARFPFGDDDAQTFAEQFLVTERNLSAENRSETNRRYVKRTPQVCNIHRLWKLFAPVILRRRKTDCGEDLVAMHRNVVRVPMGKAQAAVYRYHLDAEYLDKNGRPALGAKLQALRIIAANPSSCLLEYHPPGPNSLPYDSDHPHGYVRSDVPAEVIRSPRPYIPKLASALNLIHQILERKEQVVVFSAFHDSLDALSARLNEAGVRHVVLDGRTSPSKRGKAAAQFKLGPPNHVGDDPRSPSAGAAANKSEIRNQKSEIPVMLAGVECMSEGHSFHLCRNVILLAYSWAFDKFVQAINRIWRLNSPCDVNVYALICDGSIDRKLEGNIQEKGDAAELVLDGQLIAADPAEVNLAELLKIAQEDFKASKGEHMDETLLELEWPALRSQLAGAMAAWSKPLPKSEMPIPLVALPPDFPALVLPRPRHAVPPLVPAVCKVTLSDFCDLPLWQKAA